MTDRSPISRPRSDIHRRDFLLGVGVATAVSLAGCLGESRDPVEVETSLIATDAESGESETLVDADRDDLEPNDYVGWEFTLRREHEVEYAVEVLEGTAVNAYILTAGEFRTLEESEGEDDFSAVAGSTVTDVESVTRTVTLDQGDYYLVVINADLTPANA
ncbi:MAG: hypothetical protein V5A23_05635 [Halobacteriales archaeon]